MYNGSLRNKGAVVDKWVNPSYLTLCSMSALLVE
jgi:hypothetical protein